MKPKMNNWDRMQWAVEMRSKSCHPNGMLIGAAWHKMTPPAYAGEPSRPLLFRTRYLARKWCAAKKIECARHSPDWRFRPVRVREIILPNVSHQRHLPAEKTQPSIKLEAGLRKAISERNKARDSVRQMRDILKGMNLGNSFPVVTRAIKNADDILLNDKARQEGLAKTDNQK